jgi:hypothetical protein
MEQLNKYQKGAQVTKKILQERAHKNYYENPKICKNCGEVIKILEGKRASETRKKVFCDSSCSATYNNKIRELKQEKKEKLKKPKKEKFEFLLNMTKKELYEKHHVEVCHIKSVSAFSDDDIIRDINSVENLVGLCPNHHWEFDNGKIDISREGVIGCMGRS